MLRPTIYALIIVAALTGGAAAGPRTDRNRASDSANVEAQEARCGTPPPGATWFYFAEPGDIPAAPAARRAFAAIVAAFDGELPRDPSCLHVEVLEPREYNARYHQLDRRGSGDSSVGFHNRRLGADATVFVQPDPAQRLDVVMVHEVLHALSHRYSAEAGRRRLSHIVEGTTEYITRTIASVSFGIPIREFKTGYRDNVAFLEALMKKLGNDGPQLLMESYFTEGYDAFEREVDGRLGVSLRSAARALEENDLRGALAALRR